MTIYDRLKIKTYINAYGTVTRYGGSLMSPEIIRTMEEASKSFVDMEEFHQKAGEHIASLLGCEAAFVTSGAEAGIAVATAGIIAGKNIVNIFALPDSDNMKNEVLILKSHRSRYDQGIRVAGGVLKDIGSTDLVYPEMLEAGISEKTGFIFYLAEAADERGSLPLSDVAGICRKHGIPLVVDAAAELPPLDNFRNFLEQGADLVIFSGGKDIAGPQSSGLIVGRKELIERCRANSCPNHSIGRAMKVDKETLAGFVRAVELYVDTDFIEKTSRWTEIAEMIFEGLNDLTGIRVVKDLPFEPGIQPRNIPRVFVSPEKGGLNRVNDWHRKLQDGEPGVITGIYRESLMINPQCLGIEEVDVVVNRLSEIVRGE
ncbi:MAG: aminotransferase class V-fold PLP-dependent enzyme [Spirochaetales bacterium]|nr:aminotransferase class V-fold PLP-dependent enzyme [Spirochaetales bacterium]